MNTSQNHRYAVAIKPLYGMIGRAGMRTCEEWEKLTGVNPRRFPDYFHIYQTGLCAMKYEGERLLRAYFRQVESNFNSIGIN